MFRDLQNGYSVSVLDKSSGVAKYKSGTVKSVGLPRIDTRNTVPLSTNRVIDLVVEVDGQTLTYVVPESSSIVVTDSITLACDPSLMVNEVQTVMKRSELALSAIDTHKANVEACKDILTRISPTYAEGQEQSRRLDSIERTVSDMNKAMLDFFEQVRSERSAKKTEK